MATAPRSKGSDVATLESIIDAGTIAQRAIEKNLAVLNIGVTQQRILAAVLDARERLTPTMLAAILLQETHSVSGLLNRLEDRDLITRTRDREDRRVVWVELTPAGRQVAQKSNKIVADTARQIVDGLGETATSISTTIAGVQRVGFQITGMSEAQRKEALQRAGAKT